MTWRIFNIRYLPFAIRGSKKVEGLRGLFRPKIWHLVSKVCHLLSKICLFAVRDLRFAIRLRKFIQSLDKGIRPKFGGELFR